MKTTMFTENVKEIKCVSFFSINFVWNIFAPINIELKGMYAFM
jgi:hypothetical protein